MICPTPAAHLQPGFFMVAILVLLLAPPQAAQAQGLVKGVQQGAEAGNKAAGPVGGVLGGAIGGVVGVFSGALGVHGDQGQGQRKGKDSSLPRVPPSPARPLLPKRRRGPKQPKAPLLPPHHRANPWRY